MSKYLDNKARGAAIAHYTFMRATQLNFEKVKFETEDELKDIRSMFHSIGKTQFNKDHFEVIDYLNDNLKEIIEAVNAINEETLVFELEQYNKHIEQKKLDKVRKHPDWALACQMFHDVFNLYMEDNLKVKEDGEILEALVGNCKLELYEYRILMKRLYARNINDKRYSDGKKTIPLEFIFKNKELII